MHFLHSYTASSKVTGLLQHRGQMPIHNNISACWHQPKGIFFSPSFSAEGRVCICSRRGEQQAAGRGARLGSVQGALSFAQALSPAPAPRAPSAAALLLPNAHVRLGRLLSPTCSTSSQGWHPPHAQLSWVARWKLLTHPSPVLQTCWFQSQRIKNMAGNSLFFKSSEGAFPLQYNASV